MKDAFQKLFVVLDKRAYVRILVCLLPGIVLSKMAEQLSLGQHAKMVSVVLLLVGAGVYVGWGFIVRKVQDAGMPEDVAEEHMHQNHLSPELPPSTMADLIRLCDGNKAIAMHFLMVESEIYPQVSTAEAIALAVYRKRVEQRLAASTNVMSAD